MINDRYQRFERYMFAAVPMVGPTRVFATVQRINGRGFLERVSMDVTFGIPKGYTEVQPGLRKPTKKNKR